MRFIFIITKHILHVDSLSQMLLYDFQVNLNFVDDDDFFYLSYVDDDDFLRLTSITLGGGIQSTLALLIVLIWALKILGGQTNRIYISNFEGYSISVTLATSHI